MDVKYYTLEFEPYATNSFAYFFKHIWNDNSAPSYPEWLLQEWKTVKFLRQGSFTSREYEWKFLNESDRTIFALKWS